ncbi:hypothetical protein BCR34DRAFT_602105 [Clohesyomyces aquaticus]|uniref:Cell division control protein n=1 Tax=Clohesyomyces aquaticus TaxID=1231657 RepID=A0A1Y1ZK38_9PLEO|nr:hypothetical protein BCR34DRAFT_602105 [Clohesyomyces aquaticus]
MPGTSVSEPPSVTLSFANNFWGKDDAGVGPILERLHNAKVTSDELKSFYTARAAIEDEYARKLLHLSRKPLGSSESGTLRMSLDVIRGEVETMGKSHQSIAAQMKTELEEPLTAFAGGMKERRKIVQGGIEKLLKIKTQQTMAVNKARDRYEQDCLKIKGFLAQAHMVMGQEERKNKARLEKTQIQLATTSSEYEASVKVLEETTGRWNRDWKAACDKFQDLEEERIDYMKSSLWTFANIASTVCVSDDASCEKMRLSLEDCEVHKDIMSFIKENSTGQEIPDPPKFINFCRGDTTDSASETSDEGAYSVAQFQRTMNPAFRTSSPQPSVFESHHDPNNPLAKELGLPSHPEPAQPSQPVQPVQPVQQAQSAPQPHPAQSVRGMDPDSMMSMQHSRSGHPSHHSQPPPSARGIEPDSMQPIQHGRSAQATRPDQIQQSYSAQSGRPESMRHSHSSQSTRAPQPDPRLVQAQQQAHHQYQQSQVPHNDYPMDGMTQFCRIGPPSERSTIPSPHRTTEWIGVSREAANTSTSPVIEDNQVQKKKGFFQNSPFRRKSKHELKDPAPASITPNSRNTWAPSSKRNNENASPTRPFGQGARGNNILGGNARSASPEPVDPRANFQLNIGNNVFDVASPDSRKQKKPQKEEQEELDPIAQALAELKGVTKQSSVRVSADRYHGLATPAPPGTPAVSSTPVGGMPTPLTNAALNAVQRGTPPPSYEQPPMSRLGAPKPAFTSRQMQQTTQQYVDQKTSMFNTNSPARPSYDGRRGSTANSTSRPPTRGTTQQEAPRAASPAPPRATSPKPSLYQAPAPQSPATHRAVSPNPYAASTAGGRPRAQSRAQSASPVKPQYNSQPNHNQANHTPRPSYSSSRGGSPGYANIPRAASPQPPQPAFANSSTRPNSRANSRAGGPSPASRTASPAPQFRQSYDRPSSSRGSDMALQLAPGPGSERGEGSVYGGSQRGRGGSGQRPQSSYYGGSGGSDIGFGGGVQSQPSTKTRSKSLAEPRMYTKEGRMILHYSRAMYLYNAQIPEELSFAKGDVLAVLRLQDDGWWEAEVVGRQNGRPGLVPSNYLQNC